MDGSIYSVYSKYYDTLEGSRSEVANFYLQRIEESNPAADTLLEIACGTGSILELLMDEYEVEGLDLSEEMLRIAKDKLPNITFYNQDMTSFDTGKKYDVIISVYDSVNHLLKIEDWKRTFGQVSRHLNKNGVFVFDINTLYKLNHFAEQPTFFREFDDNYLAMDVSRDDGVFRWNIKVFENQDGNKYLLNEEDIYENSFEIDEVKKLLSEYFAVEKIVDGEGEPVSEETARAFFVSKNN